MLWYRNSGCTRNSPSSSVVTSPVSNRQLQNVLVTAQLYSKNYCTPNITDGAAKALGLVFIDKKQFGSCGWCREGQLWLEIPGSVSCPENTWGQSWDELACDIICVSVTLIAASEDQSAEVCQGFPGLGLGVCWLLGCTEAGLSPHSCALNLGSEAILPCF